METKFGIKYYRYDLDKSEYKGLINLIDRLDDSVIKTMIIETLGKPKEILEKGRKHTATKNANRIKIETSLNAVNKAIELLKSQDKKITAYSISKVSKLSFNTAKKYLDQINK